MVYCSKLQFVSGLYFEKLKCLLNLVIRAPVSLGHACFSRTGLFWSGSRHAQIQWTERRARVDWLDDADGHFYNGFLFYVSADGGEIVADQGRLYALYNFRNRHVHDT